MNEFGERIREERKRLKLSQLELARRIDPNKGQSFIANLESGSRTETPYIPELARIFGVDAYWLKTGKGDRGGALGVAEPESPYTISPAQQRAMELFSALPDRDQAHLIYLMERMLHPVHADQDSGSPPIKRSDNANLARLRPSNNVINKKIDRS